MARAACDGGSGAPRVPAAALRLSQVKHANGDRHAPSAARPESTDKSGNTIQTDGAAALARGGDHDVTGLRGASVFGFS